MVFVRSCTDVDMASKSDQLLIVVSILEGRHFPKTSRLSLMVQASFDGKQLSTDPVEHRDQPQFSTELAWELDRRTLHQHRLQRTPIKLQCFALDSVSKKRDNVGYIILDLRLVQEVKQEPRWFPLLSSKYTKQKPALLLSMQLENDSKPSQPSPDRFKAKKAPPRQGSSAVTDLLPDKLEAVLVPDQGYHQVGPADYCSDMFVLSVTVAFATRLEQLIPSSMKLSSEGSDFFFYYSLLGNDITSEPFHNLLSPSFEPERASIRIRSSKQVLQSFLSQEHSLQVHLCCGNRSLGSTEVSLSPLSSPSVDLEDKAATVESAFVLRPPRRPRQMPPTLPPDQQPTVGVSVSLRREEVVVQSVQSLGSRDGGGAQTHPAPPPGPDHRPLSSSPVRKPTVTAPPLPPLSSHTESEADSLMEEVQCSKDQPGHHDLGSVQQHIEAGAAEGGVSSVSVSAPKVSIPPLSHHYCFSLDLRSLGNLSLTQPINATLRYSYPFFGSASPIMTNPPVEVQRNMDVSLPQSFCAFNFAALPQQLQETFLRDRTLQIPLDSWGQNYMLKNADWWNTRVPLVVDVWDRDSNSRDQLIGRASVQLSLLLTSERTRGQRSSGEQSWRQTHQDRIPVIRTNCPGQKVAELSYVSTLEDLGLVKTTEVVVSDSSQNQTEHPAPIQAPPSHPVAPTQAPPSHPVAPVQAPPPHPAAPQAPRNTLEYRMALELELWKEEQEDLFDDQLKRKELNYMKALAEEWKRRDREREAVVHKKEVEYNRLEEQLQKTLSDLEKKEKQLVEAELQTQRLQRELRLEHTLTQKELQEESRRRQQDYDHLVALEKEKVRLMEEERGRLLQQIANGETRYKQLEKEFHLYREQQNVRPEFRLQSEINLLTVEKGELERKLESTTKSKLHYKQQWGRALKELAGFKQRQQENAKTRLKKQEAELEAMRLRLLATEEKEVVRQDRQELDDIRNELNRLKQQDRIGPAPSAPGPALPVPSPAPGPSINENADEQLSRLLIERDALLKTGVYTHEDRIIAELNRQIQDALSDKNH